MTTGTANAPARWQKQRKRSINQCPRPPEKRFVFVEVMQLPVFVADGALPSPIQVTIATTAQGVRLRSAGIPSATTSCNGRPICRHGAPLPCSRHRFTASCSTMTPSPAFLPDAPALNPGTVAAALNRRRCRPAGTWRGRIWSPPVVGGRRPTGRRRRGVSTALWRNNPPAGGLALPDRHGNFSTITLRVSPFL